MTRRVLRPVAFALCVAALAVLGWRAWQPRAALSDPREEIVVWTPGANADALARAPAGIAVALPAAAAPTSVRRVPDASFLRRAYPRLRRVHVIGDGLDATEAAALRDLEIIWHPPAPRALDVPQLTALSVPTTLAVGDALRVQGRVAGLPSGRATALVLEAPDRSRQTVELHGDDRGEVSFSLTSAPAAAAGRLEWTLRLGATGAPVTLGVDVVPPRLPRVLLLLGSPAPEGARLQRWLAERGARVASRTRVSAEHRRFAAAHGAPTSFEAVDATLLREFDVVIATDDALADLAAAERTALADSVAQRGLGTLLLGEPPATPADRIFSPWPPASEPTTTTPSANDDPDTRLVRLRLVDGSELAEPVAAPRVALAVLPLSRVLARDTQDRVVSAAVRHGRGWIARSLALDTWRWQQAGHPETYARFWSALLSALAAPAAGQWQPPPAHAPRFAGAPLPLAWVGPAASAPRSVRIVPHGGGPIELPLAPDPTDADRLTALFYPPQPGWYELRDSAGAGFAFHVEPADALPGLQAQARRDATATLVNANTSTRPTAAPSSASPTTAPPASSAVSTPTPATAATPPPLDALAFGLFLLGAAVLFWDTRRAG